jgi:hypothetical protein
MAAYGTLVAWATAMGHSEAANFLQQTLDEEKAADAKLSALAEGGINEQAADSAHAAGDEEDSPALMGGGRQTASGNDSTKRSRRR